LELGFVLREFVGVQRILRTIRPAVKHGSL
jgi:hypothetical protein